MSTTANIEYLVELGMSMERLERRNRRLRRRNQKMSARIEELKRQRVTQVSDQEVPTTDDEQIVRATGYDILVPSRPPPFLLEEWRRKQKMPGRVVRIDERFKTFMAGAIVYLIDGAHVLITNIRRMNKEDVQNFSPVAHILCKSANAVRGADPNDALGIQIGGRGDPVVWGKGWILSTDITRQIMLKKMLPDGPSTTWSFFIPWVQDVDTLRSVLGYANQ